ncbi:MAG TPA: RHS repeat-associated core domain-containing protein, partial [Acidimicrobiales bacterium]|nr:RHS repeat-associated core domain-containing protein [Acidimicrobiales bacterium]
IGTQSYTAYGSLASSTGTDPTPFGFAGGYTDPTGLIYLVARYYDPSTGQYLTVDPAVRQTQQTYEYAAGDPTNFLDPSGLFPVSEAGISCKPKGAVIKCTASTKHIWSSLALAMGAGTLSGLEAAGAGTQINQQKYVIRRTFPNGCLSDHGDVELNDAFAKMQDIVEAAANPPALPWSSVGPLIVTYDQESVTVNIFRAGDFDFEPIVIDPDVLG